MRVRRRPEKARKGVAIENGKFTPTKILAVTKTAAKGAHMNNVKVFKGVGFMAKRPSWKINGLGY